uniref:Uncharacterized protein n=1 Tax=Spermophilus dauricus TaxID=99837 RepID=A0A8C9Q447_SPEDA
MPPSFLAPYPFPSSLLPPLSPHSSYPLVIFDCPPLPLVSNLSPTPAASFSAEPLGWSLLSVSTASIPSPFITQRPGVQCASEAIFVLSLAPLQYKLEFHMPTFRSSAVGHFIL